MIQRLLCVSAAILVSVVCFAKGDIKISNVWKAYDAFNTVYLDTDKYIYKNTDRDSAAIDRFHGAAAIWCQPMYVDMALNAAELARRTGDKKREAKYSDLARRIIDGNIKQYLDFDFDNCDLARGWFIYDDIQWWTITIARAYLATGDTRYRDLAEKGFARVWYGSPRVGDTGSYADPAKDLGGGMFWAWSPIEAPRNNKAEDSKLPCINFPTVVAAMLLYQAAPADRVADPNPEKWTSKFGTFVRPHYETKNRYLEMAEEIYDWSVDNLTVAETGMVICAAGRPLLYNQGTFIGAGVLLYLATGDSRYLNRATKGTDFCINELSKEHGLLPWAHNSKKPYSQGSLEQGIYPAIWIQYMKPLIEECGQSQYTDFISKNIHAGWNNRDYKRNISDGEFWNKTTDENPIGSYAASSIPALMLVYGLLERR